MKQVLQRKVPGEVISGKVYSNIYKKLFFGIFFCLNIFVFLNPLSSHEIRPAYLEIKESTDNIEILWKIPVAGESAIKLIPVLSSGWLSDSVSDYSVTSTALVRKWNIHGKESVEGMTITIEGLENTITDVLVNITFADGIKIHHVIKPSQPAYTIARNQTSSVPVWDYLRLGIDHILFGFDHLLFVLGLILLVKDKWKLVKTITAFTLAHSITLTSAALGFVKIPSLPVEAVIALSIIFLAVELVHLYQGKDVFSEKYPWVVAFIFGLLHGFGFASALSSVGLPQDEIPLTLFLFNAGVEIGQLIFVLLILSTGYVISKIFRNIPDWVKWIPPYVIGSLASYWFIERINLIFYG